MIRAGIIGFAHMHVNEIALYISEHPDFELVAAADAKSGVEEIPPFRYTPAWNRDNIRENYCKNIYSDYREMLEKESLEIITALAKKHGLETRVLHANDYTEPVDIHGEAYTLFTKVIADTFPGLPSSPYVMTGATDAQFYQPICKNCLRFAPVIYGPEQMKGMHGLDENIEYNCLPGAVRFYKNLIKAQR